MGGGISKEQYAKYEEWERTFQNKEATLLERSQALDAMKQLHGEKAASLSKHEEELNEMKKFEDLKEERLQRKEDALHKEEDAEKADKEMLEAAKAAWKEEKEHDKEKLQADKVAWDEEKEHFALQKRAWDEEKSRFEEERKTWQAKMMKGPWADRLLAITGSQNAYDTIMAMSPKEVNENPLAITDYYIKARMTQELGEFTAEEIAFALESVRSSRISWSDTAVDISDLQEEDPYAALTAVENRVSIVIERVKLQRDSERSSAGDRLIDLLLKDPIDEEASKAILDAGFDVNKECPRLNGGDAMHWLTPLIRIPRHLQMLKKGEISWEGKPGCHLNAMKWLLANGATADKCIEGTGEGRLTALACLHYLFTNFGIDDPVDIPEESIPEALEMMKLLIAASKRQGVMRSFQCYVNPKYEEEVITHIISFGHRHLEVERLYVDVLPEASIVAYVEKKEKFVKEGKMPHEWKEGEFSTLDESEITQMKTDIEDKKALLALY